MQLFFKNNVVFYSLAGIIVLGTFISLFTPELKLFERSEDFTVYFMLGFLALGLIFLFINQSKLLLLSFCCAASLCLHLKQESNPLLRLPEITSEPKISIAHINVTASKDECQDLIEKVFQMDVDVLSFQEVTSEWAYDLESSLEDLYPNIARNIRQDPFGMMIFSKYEISATDTLYTEMIPNLEITVGLTEDHTIKIVASYLLPSMDSKEQLSGIAKFVRQQELPVINLGDYNQVYWSDEISDFRDQANLKNSRRSSLQVHYDHIFYSNEIECVEFSEIVDLGSSHLGIYGSYQFEPRTTALLTTPIGSILPQ